MGGTMTYCRTKCSPQNLTAQRGLTLIELLVTIGVIACLAAFGAGVYNKALESGSRTREFAAGKSLITAYLNYTADNDGRLMIGHYEGSSPELKVEDYPLPDGSLVNGAALDRYPYRLASYFDYRIDGVLLVNDNKKQIARQFAGGMKSYGTSLCPAFGINYYFAGGYKVDGEFSKEQLEEAAFRLAQVPKPSSMLIFATAFSPDVAGSRIAGRFGVEPPAYRAVLWDQNLHVDPRHAGKALCAFLDGSLRLMGVDELRDMRYWSRNAQLADNPNYRVAATGSGGGGGRR